MLRFRSQKLKLSLLFVAWLTGTVCIASCQPNSVGICVEATSTAGHGKLPQFEVATIKPFGSSGLAGIQNFPGGRIAAGHMNLRILLMFACNVQMFQVVGGPAWADSDFFNIEAKPPESSSTAKLNPANPKVSLSDEQRGMLLALLLDRFQLKFHIESKDGLVYLLERGNEKLNLDAPKDPNAFPWIGGIEGGAISSSTGIAGKNISMPMVALRLSRYLERPVIDKTGMSGSFDFEYKNEEADANAQVTRDDIVSSILTSVRRIGLKLTPAKAPMETIVIDHVEKPSPN
jgi:uncharacterized protein (TIGR03435 family)